MEIIQYPSSTAEERLLQIVNRNQEDTHKEEQAVRDIIDQVAQQGDAALLTYARQFDTPNLTLEMLPVGPEEFQAAEQAVVPEFKQALMRAAAQITQFHQYQAEKSWMATDRPGVLLGQLVRPVGRAGIYVPGGQGGRTPLVSSVLMDAIPARIAGVPEVIMATPATETGTVNPHLLIAAREVGIQKVFKVGSAWAIAAMALGTETIPRVDVIVGPGNIYVTLAKKILSGTVGIDMIAGPSEILVIADETAEPAYVAADLLSQAEHDPLSSAVLLTDSAALARKVRDQIQKQLPQLTRREIAQAALERFGALIHVPNLNDAFELANRFAPEHLELLMADPMDRIQAVRNAGAVFIGPYTPEPVGDYVAGPNHVLPTAGTARFASALSVEVFTKKTSLLRYTREALQEEGQAIIRLAETEGLTAHAAAVRLRLDSYENT